MDSLTIYGDLSAPFPANYSFPFPLSCGELINASRLLIECVLLPSALPEIAAAVVKFVSVAMVYVFSFWEAHDEAVHENAPLVSVESGCIFGVPGMNGPIPLRQPFKVSGVNDCVKPLRQWNKFVGLVLRLDDFVSRYTWSRHFLPHIGSGYQPHSIMGTCA